MTTITALNVRLGMDVSNFSEGANLAKNETTRVATIMRQSVPASQKYKTELDLINRAFSETGKKSQEYATAISFLEKKYATLTTATTEAVKATSSMAAAMAKAASLTNPMTTSMAKFSAVTTQTAQATKEVTKATRDSVSASTAAMASIKQLAAAYLGMQTVAKSIKLATEVEDATVAFEVLTGSVQDGALLFQQVRDFSEKSPITFGGAIQATRTMMGFGVAVQDVQKNLQMLSDVTGGNNERFKTLALAFSQTSAAGRLMGQDLLQMVNAGFNPLQQISKMTGESLIDLKKRMEDGGISAEEVRAAFEAATAEGGMFHGMTERLAETMGGKLNIAFSQLEKALAATGQAMAPLIIMLTEGFDKGQGGLNLMVKAVEKISDGIGLSVALLTDLWNLTGNKEIDRFLAEVDKRTRERENAAADAASQKFENEKKAVAAVAVVDKKAIEDAEKARLKAIETANKARMKAIKEAADAEKKAAEAFQRELESARSEAMKFFEDQQKKNEKMRSDVAAGPGTGIELRSAGSVKFWADAVNRNIGAAAVPDKQQATQQDIAKKTAELLIAQRAANAAQQRQIQLAADMLIELQQNGFRRIR